MAANRMGKSSRGYDLPRFRITKLTPVEAFVSRVSCAPALLALAFSAIAASGQNAPAVPTFNSSARLVQVSVIARDKNGPAADLTKDDFVVLDRGKPQKIAVFSTESGDAEVEDDEEADQPVPPLPLNTYSDLPRYGIHAPRSVTVVLLDNLNTLYGSTPGAYEHTPYWFEDAALSNAKTHLIEFIKKLDPRDRVAIYGLTNSLHVLCDFTSNRAQLLAIVKGYDATGMTSREGTDPSRVHIPNLGPRSGSINATVNQGDKQVAGISDQGRAGVTMAALQAIADHVANIPGRKNLVWLTANLPFSGSAMARILSPAQIAAYPVDGRGLLPRASLEAMEGVEDSNAEALGTFARPDSPEPVGIDTMKTLADETGGEAFVNTNDLTGAIRKAVEDSAVTYTLGFYIDRAAADGKFHELKVQVKQKGVSVRYPKGYYAIEDSAATKDQNRNSVVTALRSPVESSTIPLQVTVNRANASAADALNLVGSVDVRALRLAEKGGVHKGAVSVFVIEQDQSGKVLRESSNAIDLQLTEQQYQAFLKSGMHFTKHLQPKAGATTLRILVEDPATAEVGSVIIPLT